MSSLKKVRENPLLAVPERGRPLELTREDEEVLEKFLDIERREPPSMLARRLYYLKGVGYPVNTTEDDERKIRDGLAQQSKRADDITLALMYRHMLGVGLDVEVQYRGRLEMWMKDQQALAQVTNSMFTSGAQIAQAHALMSEIGFKTHVTDAERSLMLEGLEKARREGIATELVLQHYNMRVSGLQTTITKQDDELLQRELRQARKEKNASKLMILLYYMRRIYPETEKETPMPPVKEYVRR